MQWGKVALVVENAACPLGMVNERIAVMLVQVAHFTVAQHLGGVRWVEVIPVEQSVQQTKGNLIVCSATGILEQDTDGSYQGRVGESKRALTHRRGGAVAQLQVGGLRVLAVIAHRHVEHGPRDIAALVRSGSPQPTAAAKARSGRRVTGCAAGGRRLQRGPQLRQTVP